MTLQDMEKKVREALALCDWMERNAPEGHAELAADVAALAGFLLPITALVDTGEMSVETGLKLTGFLLDSITDLAAKAKEATGKASTN